jgi:hypothetical protein
MARRPSGGPGGLTTRARSIVGVVLVVVLALVVVLYLYGTDMFKSKGPSKPNTAPNDVTVKELNEPIVVAPNEPVKVEPNTSSQDTAPPGDVAPNPDATELISEVLGLMAGDASKIAEARNKLNQTLKMPMNAQQRLFVKDQLSALANRWLFSRDLFPGDTLCALYKVEPGDQLTSIGKQHKVPYEIIMAINNIARPELLVAGKTIKVINGPFHAKIYRSTFTLDLYLQDMFVRSFRVGLGKPGRETPTGLWQVAPGGKLVEPPWTDPDTGRTYHAEDPDYPLGSRWIGLIGLEGKAKGRAGFAIHGTKDPNQIGKLESRGCIRMHNGDVVLMYNLLEPGQSLVTVED